MTGETKDNEDHILEMGKDNITYEELQGEVLAFHTNCPECNTPCDTNMKVTRKQYDFINRKKHHKVLWVLLVSGPAYTVLFFVILYIFLNLIAILRYSTF